LGEKWPVKFSLTMRLPRHCRVLLHAAKLRHGADGFTFPPKEDTLRIFSPERVCRVLLQAAKLRHRTDGYLPLRKKTCLGFFRPKGFGRVRTRELVYQRPA
jgi:hypothetical protein